MTAKVKNVYVSLGKRDLILSLTKTLTKEGCKSGVKINNRSKIKLACPIIIGEPIYKINKTDNNPLRRPRKHPHTSIVQGIRINENGTPDGKSFIIETETSFYLAKFS